MYRVSVSRDFVAQHFLIGGDWGDENNPHSHHYRIEVELTGTTLDRHGYLVDIVEIESRLDALIARYRDRTLNDLDEFKGLNPSIERFSRVLWERFTEGLGAANIGAATVRLWETPLAWAAYAAPVGSGGRSDAVSG